MNQFQAFSSQYCAFGQSRLRQFQAFSRQMADFKTAFRNATADLPALGSNIHYSASADRLRKLLQEGPLKLTEHSFPAFTSHFDEAFSVLDLREAPENFFAAHSVLSEYATQVGPGFGIRFTVQFNLFAGTVIALGNSQQVAALSEMQASGKLGCFCLTEKLAGGSARPEGVNSGLVVNTTCTWDESKQMFLLDCPDAGAYKNWISQGLSAVMASVP
eukprot:s2262_g1.t1